MKNPVLVLIALALTTGCSKTEEKASASTTNGSVPAATAAATTATTTATEVDCDTVVEKIASLNRADSRGEAEKKLWRKMCAEMKPVQKSCVIGAASMDAMKGCLR